MTLFTRTSSSNRKTTDVSFDFHVFSISKKNIEKMLSESRKENFDLWFAVEISIRSRLVWYLHRILSFLSLKKENMNCSLYHAEWNGTDNMSSLLIHYIVSFDLELSITCNCRLSFALKTHPHLLPKENMNDFRDNQRRCGRHLQRMFSRLFLIDELKKNRSSEQLFFYFDEMSITLQFDWSRKSVRKISSINVG